jgi:hypothetical protein
MSFNFSSTLGVKNDLSLETLGVFIFSYQTEGVASSHGASVRGRVYTSICIFDPAKTDRMIHCTFFHGIRTLLAPILGIAIFLLPD